MIKLYYKIINANRSTILTYTLIFLSIFVIFGLFSGEMQEVNQATYEQVKPKISILDDDHSELSRVVTKQLSKDNEVIETGTSMEEMKDALFFGQIHTILVIPKGFQTQFEAGKQDLIKLQQRPDDANGILIKQGINSFLTSMSAYQQVDTSLSYKEAGSLVSKDLSHKATIKMEKTKKDANEDWMRVSYYNFLSYVIFSVIVMTAGAAMHTIYRSEMLKRSLIAPINSSQLNIKIVIANITFALGLLSVFTIVILCIRKNMFSSSGALFILNSIVFALVSIAFAYMVTTIISNKKNGHDKLDMVCNVFGLLMAFLGGAFLPQSFIPENVLTFSQFLPSYWYVKLNDSMLSITDVTSDIIEKAVQCMGIQLLFAITFIVIGLVVMKNKRTQGEIIDSDYE